MNAIISCLADVAFENYRLLSFSLVRFVHWGKRGNAAVFFTAASNSIRVYVVLNQASKPTKPKTNH